jgi:hypothetical protein
VQETARWEAFTFRPGEERFLAEEALILRQELPSRKKKRRIPAISAQDAADFSVPETSAGAA